MCEPAHPFSLLNDHDYHATTKTDDLLHHLNVSAISSDQCTHLEMSMRGQARNPLWKSERLHRLHSSNFGQTVKPWTGQDRYGCSGKRIYIPGVCH